MKTLERTKYNQIDDNRTIIEEVLITPSRAARMLEFNASNRPLNQRHVEFLASEMKRGKWKFNGDTIRMSGDRLLDGQHRLSACVESGCSFCGLVVNGLDEDVFDTIDQGNRKRSGADTLSNLGAENTSLTAAALAWIIRYKENAVDNNRRITNAEIRDAFIEYDGITLSAKLISSYGKMHASPSKLAALHYLFSEIDRDAANAFVESLVKGVNLAAGSPVYALRERLIAASLNKAKMPRQYWPAVIIKAWNATRTNRTVKWIRYHSTEKFPTII